MLEEILQKISSRLTYKVILDTCAPTKEPLMHRYKIFRSRWGNMYLHKFLRSDYDRAMHDHPWSFISLVLTNGYYEHTASGRRFRPPGSLNIRPAEWLHWVEIEKPAWTLVFVRPKRREWGFLSSIGWLPEKEFKNSPEGGCSDD